MVKADKAGGARAVARILNTLDFASREEVLDSIEMEDPDLASEIRSLMFVFEDLAGLDARSLGELARAVDPARLALALRGLDASVVDAFCKSMSQRQAAMLKDDVEALGPQRASDVEGARQEVLRVARRLEAEGRLALRPGPGDVYI
jgi:flagellar motor switch protein FliG